MHQLLNTIVKISIPALEEHVVLLNEKCNATAIDFTRRDSSSSGESRTIHIDIGTTIMNFALMKITRSFKNKFS